MRDLDLVESAFIAGSVKGPSAYDPFIKFTKERRERAIKNALAVAARYASVRLNARIVAELEAGPGGGEDADEQA